ncbi:MAG: hypothetical protein FJZ64_00830 [Chlamydiae bacterium]|nr:hypothetical protein [Chlamydiota bacterium]
MKNKNVLISGAGIAGLTLAYWLKKQGFTPTIIEKHPFLRKGGYKVDVRGAALEVAKRMGIYPSLLDENVNIQRAQFITSDHKIFELDGDILGFCSKEDLEINRFDLCQILLKAVGEIEIIFDDSITHFDEKVHFEKHKPRTFDLVIGADGAHSKVRRLAFGEDARFLMENGVRFCVFPIPNLFGLNRSEIVYFNQGKFAAAYAVNHHSYACLAFKPKKNPLFSDAKAVFEEHFKNLGWEIPRLIQEMKANNDCYFGSTTQTRMPFWSKGNIALVGDAAYSAQGIGTSFAMVGAYILARELGRAGGDYAAAFSQYEKSMRKFVEKGQDISLANHAMLAMSDSSWLIKCQLYIMKMVPGKFLRFFTAWGRWRMKRAANAIDI